MTQLNTDTVRQCFVQGEHNILFHVNCEQLPVSLQYCHYVAGLVGIGLSRLFSASGLECEEVGQDHKLANSMGLFLQKTNIIRDYLEDVQEGRYFWPKEVFKIIFVDSSLPFSISLCACVHVHVYVCACVCMYL